MSIIIFKPKQVTKKFLAVLPERIRVVVSERFGLGPDGTRKTLESIGQKYGVTRERIRQIEDFGLKSIQKSDVYKDEQAVFDNLREALVEYGGGVAPENHFFNHVSKDESTQNHLHLLLVLGEPFEKKKEDEKFVHRWIVEESMAKTVHDALERLVSGLKEDELITEDDLLERFYGHLSGVPSEYRNETIARRWLSLSKMIGTNPLGEWGIASSPNVNARGMRDYAFLVIRRHGSPMHFTEVAKEITKLFGKKAHTATCHNELIKDGRFVLVGRGLYALTEWGYARGIVRDVISDVLKEHGALSKEEIIDKVMQERYVKPNTIIVNLQNGNYFKKTDEGDYTLA
ncbi:MAG: hypothetical protein HZC04_00670 [Candidatus Lloydbacteria bacterium]|nr:hypothetical protein [Candidatus Lloydbacteria bacterium]